nr:hypothetical protein [Tanacetum cinerariifolium]
MQTRSSSNFVGEPSTNPTSTNLKRRNRRRSKQRVEPFSLLETIVVMMADQRTMAELLRAPTQGYTEEIVVPPIPAKHFELKHSLINLVTSKKFFGFEKEDPHAHIRYFNKITSMLKYKDAWDRFKDLLRAYPPARFYQISSTRHLLQWLNPFDQDYLNFSAGGNLLERSAQDVLKIIENKSKVRSSRNKSIVSQAKASNVDSSEIASAVVSAVTSAMTAMFKQHQVTLAPASVKAVEESCVTCGGAHSYRQCPATDDNTFSGYHDNIQGYVSAAAVNYNQGNAGELKAITTQSGIVLDGHSVLMPPPFINPEEDERAEETLTNSDLAEYTIKVPPPLGRPFLRTARALIDVYGEELILRDSDKRLILNMKHDTLSYSNKPQRESINMIDIYNISYEDYLEDLFANKKITNHLSGNPTFSSEPDTLTFDLTLPKVKDDIFDLEGDIVLIKKLLNLDSTKDLPPSHNINPLSGSTTSSSPSLTTSEISDYSLEEFADELTLIESFPQGNDDMTLEDVIREIKYLLNRYPLTEYSPNNDLIYTIPEMFTDEHTLDYSSLPRYDDTNDDIFDLKTDNYEWGKRLYDDPFDFKENKIKDFKLLIDELDSSRSSSFLPHILEGDSVLYDDFSEVDTLTSTDNEDTVFNLGIFVHENLYEVTNRVAPNKNVKKISSSNASLIIEDYNPSLSDHELPFHIEILGPYSSCSSSSATNNLCSRTTISTVPQTTCRPAAVRPRDQDDSHDDDHPEGENSAKRQKTSEYEAYVSGESSFGQINKEEQGPSTLGNQEQDDDYDFWTESYASDDDEIPMKSSVICERVHDFQLGIKSYQQKVNLIVPKISFLGIKEHEMFFIIYEHVHGIIYKNIKKEKRVMRHSEIHKFCDVTLNRVLEGLKSYNNDVKYSYVQKDLTKDKVEYLKLFEEEIEDRLKYRRHMRRWEIYVNERPLGP